MASQSSDTTTLHARCHCKSHTHDFKIPNDQLPLRTEHCHCNMCRQTNGAPFETYAAIYDASIKPYTDASPPPSTLSYYSCTPSARRYFCSKCGTHLFFHSVDGDTWSLNAGALTTANPGLLKYQGHIYTKESSGAEGFVVSDLLDDRLPRYPAMSGGDSKPLTSAEIKTLVEINAPAKGLVIDPAKRLEVSCYCGRVKGLLQRPFVHPDNKWLKEFASADQKRWTGSHCVCESCRLSTGNPLIHFIFPPAEHIEWLDSAHPGSGPEADGGGGDDDWRAKAGMTWWRSTEEVVRGFCGTCGASVIYLCTDRPGMEPVGDQSMAKWGKGTDAMSDIYVGLLRTSNSDGDRLADWVEYQDKLGSFGWEAKTYDEQLHKFLESGVKKFAEARKV